MTKVCKRYFVWLFVIFLLWVPGILADFRDQYNVAWDTQSKNSSESMPCGGHDIGLNVWVENGDVLFYMQRSGSLAETNEYLKLECKLSRLFNERKLIHESKLITETGYCRCFCV